MAAGRSGAGRGRKGTPTSRFAKVATALLAPKDIVNKSFERPFASTNKGNLMQTDGGNFERLTSDWRVLDNRFITGTANALRSWLLTNGPTPT